MQTSFATHRRAASLDELIVRLKKLERLHGLARTLAIGELVLNEFFCGDLARWRTRSRGKDSSVRSLAARPDCPFCKSALTEAVAIYVAARELPFVLEAKCLTSSHLSAVLKLAPEQRARLLEQAERESWSVKKLREAAASSAPIARSSNRSPLRAEMLRLRAALRDLHSRIDDVDAARASGLQDPHALHEIADEIAALTPRLLELSRTIERTPTRE